MSGDHPSNPYSPISLDGPDQNDGNTRVDFAPVIKRWELYRLWYNAILVIYVLVWTVQLGPEALLDSLFWMQLVLLGTLANIFFSLGPTVEGYGRYLRLWNPIMSRLLFVAGLLLSGALATFYLFVRLR